MTDSIFDQLLSQSQEQDQPQRLLFLFAKSETDQKRSDDYQSTGHLSPIMCVDKLPQELTTYKELLKEADSIHKGYDLVFIASLSGSNNQAPSTEEAEPFLNKMTNDLASGDDLGRYVILDRQENPIEMSRI